MQNDTKQDGGKITQLKYVSSKINPLGEIEYEWE